MAQLVSVINFAKFPGGSGTSGGPTGQTQAVSNFIDLVGITLTTFHPPTKIEATLMEVTTVSGQVAVSTAALNVAPYSHASVFIDHAYLDTAASGTFGVEYTIQTAQKSSGNDNWRNYAAYRTALLVPGFAVTPLVANLPGETMISLASNGASGFTATDRAFFANNADFSKSEWVDIVQASQTTGVLIRDGLTNTQVSSWLFGKAEQYVILMRLDDVERLRVTVNNCLYNNTNKAIAFRARAILGNA